MDSPNLTLAREALKGHTRLAVYNNGEITTMEDRGIKPILLLINDNPEVLRGACVADKIIGKASALLMVYAGVKECFGEVVSKYAAEVLKEAGIPLSYINVVSAISNRRGDGICPMEKAVAGISDAEEAYSVLYKKVFENN